MKTCDRIKILRILNGYTQDGLALAAGVSRVSVSRWENCQAPPSARTLKMLAHIFNIEAKFLSGDCENPPEGLIWCPQLPKNPAYFGQMKEDLVEGFMMWLLECGVVRVIQGRMANGMTLWLLDNSDQPNGGDMLVCRSPLIILSDSHILTGFINEAISHCMVGLRVIDKPLKSTDTTELLAEVAWTLLEEDGAFDKKPPACDVPLPANDIDDLVNALKLCAEQVRLSMELHDEDEDAPIAYDAAQSILTKIGRF